jgi:hypothetical protein
MGGGIFVDGRGRISALLSGGVVGVFSRRNCGIVGGDVFIKSDGRTSKDELLRGGRGPAGFRLCARREYDLSPNSSTFGVLTGDDKDEAV